MSLERFDQELRVLEDVLSRDLRVGRVSPRLRSRIEYLLRTFAVEAPSAEATSAARNSIIALRTGSVSALWRSLRELREALARGRYRELPSVAQQQRVEELESEVEELRGQLEAVTKDKQENAVKKFNNSKNRVFAIMPFSPDFDDTWTGGIRRACEQNNFAPLRVDQVSLSSWITSDVKDFIGRCTTVIADVTGSNPNVMFELGHALAKEKEAIIISQRREADKIPFDIAGIRRLEYTNSWQGIEKLAKDLATYLLATLDLQKQRQKKGAVKGRKVQS